MMSENFVFLAHIGSFHRWLNASKIITPPDS